MSFVNKSFDYFRSLTSSVQKQYASTLARVNEIEPRAMALSDSDLRRESLSLRYRAKSGESLTQLLPEAYALVREAGRRTMNMRHYDVQILGGIVIHHRAIAEMRTGEGKTLTATLPLYLNALIGKGAHLVTVNDYLAKRDMEWMSPIYRVLGMEVGLIQTQMRSPDRRKAYACDVTYGTAKELGFDFLRDRLLLRQISSGQGSFLDGMLGRGTQGGGGGEQPVQRNAYFALVDEADSILIDEARTPLIISALPTEEEQLEVACYLWSAEVAHQFTEEDDYEYEEDKKQVELTSDGRKKVRTLPKPSSLDSVGMTDIYTFVERAIRVERDYIRDRQYVCRDGEIVIVDEFTGRLGEGRKWRDGIHQAVEAKEHLEVTVATGQAARVTIQDFFIRYKHLAGMTGTARTSAHELKKIYRLRVVSMPSNKPLLRIRLPEIVFGNEDAKWDAIVGEVQQMHQLGRPVLIGTRSIDKSELLSSRLQAAGVPHEVLNANLIAREAEIVSHAGERGRVTVSTNMAGRGTDIKLGPGVEELGGLHVIITEMHDSARIDWQLIGRCSRQGDPGTFRYFLALDDEILGSGLGIKKGKSLEDQGVDSRAMHNGQLTLFYKAQKKIERKHFRDRKVLLHHEKERTKMQTQMGQDPYLDTPG